MELKAEHPRLNDNEIANIVYIRTGRKLGKHTPGRVVSEEVVPLKLFRLFEPYHEARDVREARQVEVTLHLDDWSVKYKASYMRVSSTTVNRKIGRWIEDGEADLATMDFIRRSQENPELGAFRIHAALEQKRGAEVSVRTVGRVMAVHRELYRLAKPKRSPKEKVEMPFGRRTRRRTAGSCAPWATKSRRYGVSSAPVGMRSEYRNSASAKAIKKIHRICHNRFVAGVLMSKPRETLEATWPATPGSRRPN